MCLQLRHGTPCTRWSSHLYTAVRPSQRGNKHPRPVPADYTSCPPLVTAHRPLPSLRCPASRTRPHPIPRIDAGLLHLSSARPRAAHSHPPFRLLSSLHTQGRFPAPCTVYYYARRRQPGGRNPRCRPRANVSTTARHPSHQPARAHPLLSHSAPVARSLKTCLPRIYLSLYPRLALSPVRIGVVLCCSCPVLLSGLHDVL
ncbi:hypothetical protein C2E23DRAFT_529105 [Lenzites betulinus]|nr:hypothetical protein C2E23DRAFT_529105 [Lenzites betulinus]